MTTNPIHAAATEQSNLGSGRVWICRAWDLGAVIDQASPTSIISITEPASSLPVPAFVPESAILRLAFHDITDAATGLMAPSEVHVRAIIEFAGH